MALTHHAETRPLALRLLTLCIQEDAEQASSEMARLVAWLRQLSLRRQYAGLIASLRAVETCIRALPLAADSFRTANGFPALLSVVRGVRNMLHGIAAPTPWSPAASTASASGAPAAAGVTATGVLSEAASLDLGWEVVRHTFAVAVIAWRGSATNPAYCHDTHFFRDAATAVLDTGLLRHSKFWLPYGKLADAVLAGNGDAPIFTADDGIASSQSASRKLQPAISSLDVFAAVPVGEPSADAVTDAAADAAAAPPPVKGPTPLPPRPPLPAAATPAPTVRVQEAAGALFVQVAAGAPAPLERALLEHLANVAFASTANMVRLADTESFALALLEHYGRRILGFASAPSQRLHELDASVLAVPAAPAVPATTVSVVGAADGMSGTARSGRAAADGDGRTGLVVPLIAIEEEDGVSRLLSLPGSVVGSRRSSRASTTADAAAAASAAAAALAASAATGRRDRRRRDSERGDDDVVDLDSQFDVDDAGTIHSTAMDAGNGFGDDEEEEGDDDEEAEDADDAAAAATAVGGDRDGLHRLLLPDPPLAALGGRRSARPRRRHRWHLPSDLGPDAWAQPLHECHASLWSLLELSLSVSVPTAVGRTLLRMLAGPPLAMLLPVSLLPTPPLPFIRMLRTAIVAGRTPPYIRFEPGQDAVNGVPTSHNGGVVQLPPLATVPAGFTGPASAPTASAATAGSGGLATLVALPGTFSAAGLLEPALPPHQQSGGRMLGPRVWPPEEGHTFMAWFRIVDVRADAKPYALELLTVVDDHHRIQLAYHIDPATLLLTARILGSESVPITAFTFRTRCWYHLAIVHSRVRTGLLPNLGSSGAQGTATGGGGGGGFGGSAASATLAVYVDGVLVDAPQPCGYLSTFPGRTVLTMRLGHQHKHREAGSGDMGGLVWDLGPAWLLDRALDLVRVNAAYNAGPQYPGVFYGPLTQFFTTETVDAVNLRLVGQRTDAVDPRNGHTVFATSSLDVTPDRVLFALHPWYGWSTPSGDRALIYPTHANMGSPLLERAAATVRGTFLAVAGSGMGEAVRRNAGVAAVLRLVELADDVPTLSAALDLLAALTKFNARAAAEMTALTGYRYELVAAALKSKKHLITASMLSTLLYMAGKDPDNRRCVP